MSDLNRRDALALFSAIGAGIWRIGPGGGRRPVQEDVVAWVRRELDAEGLHELGQAYLADHSDEADAARLVALVAPGGPPNVSLGRYLTRRVREEFHRGDVVDVAGWRLARSEARLAALAALLRPAPG